MTEQGPSGVMTRRSVPLPPSGGQFTDDQVSVEMRNKRRCSVMAFSALGVIAIGLTGCSNKQPEGKTQAEITAFNGDMTKAPAAYRAKMEAGQSAAAQKRVMDVQKEAAAKNAGTVKP